MGNQKPITNDHELGFLFHSLSGIVNPRAFSLGLVLYKRRVPRGQASWGKAWAQIIIPIC